MTSYAQCHPVEVGLILHGHFMEPASIKKTTSNIHFIFSPPLLLMHCLR